MKKKGFFRVDVAPALSPDGDRVAFIEDGMFSKDIVLASAVDGKILSHLVRGERSGNFESLRYLYTAIGWSPDGKRIAFPSKHGAGDVLNILDVDSKKILRTYDLSFDALYSPCWDPTGRRIAFVGIRGGQSDLFALDTETGDLQRFTNDAYMARDPQWSPDGKRIAFVTDQGEAPTSTISCSSRRCGTSTKEITSSLTERQNIAPQWGPDGRYRVRRTGPESPTSCWISTRIAHRLTNLIGRPVLIESVRRSLGRAKAGGSSSHVHGRRMESRDRQPLDKMRSRSSGPSAPRGRGAAVAQGRSGAVVPRWRQHPLRPATEPHRALAGSVAAVAGPGAAGAAAPVRRRRKGRRARNGSPVPSSARRRRLPPRLAGGTPLEMSGRRIS
jgi:hypothetical protein